MPNRIHDKQIRELSIEKILEPIGDAPSWILEDSQTKDAYDEGKLRGLGC